MKELGLFQICSPLGKMSISDPGQETQGPCGRWRPDIPDGGPGLPQRRDSFSKGPSPCFFSHLSPHSCRKGRLLPRTRERSQVTLAGDCKGPVPPWTLDLCSDENVTSSCHKLLGQEKDGHLSSHTKEDVKQTWVWTGDEALVLPSCMGQEAVVAAAVASSVREASRTKGHAGRSALLPCVFLISAQMYSVPLTLNIFY